MIQTIVEVCESDEAIVAARARWVTEEGYEEIAGLAAQSEGDIARAYRRKDGSKTDWPVRIKAFAADGSRVRVLVFKGNL